MGATALYWSMASGVSLLPIPASWKFMSTGRFRWRKPVATSVGRVLVGSRCAVGGDARRSVLIHRSIGVRTSLFGVPSACRAVCGGASVDSSSAGSCVCCVGMGGAGQGDLVQDRRRRERMYLPGGGVDSQKNLYARGVMASMWSVWLHQIAGRMLVVCLRVHVIAGRLVAVAVALLLVGPRPRACAMSTLRGSCLVSNMGLWSTPMVGLHVWMDPCCSMPRVCCWSRVKDTPTHSHGFYLDT